MIDEATQVKVEKSGMSVKRIISKATSIWKGTKKEIVYSDDLSDEEKGLFAFDAKLVNLILLKDQIDKDITEHINTTVKAFRHQKQAKAENELMEEGMTVKEEN